MRAFIFLLLLSCTSPVVHKNIKLPSDPILNDKLIFVDGCMVGIINAFIATGINIQNIDPTKLVEICHELTEDRFNTI